MHWPDAGCGWYEPGVHCRHAIAPALAVNEPVGQFVHRGWPGLGLYEPTAHAEQFAAAPAPESGFAVPAGHAVHATWPSFVLNVPTGHATHADNAADPVFALNVAAGHAVQANWPSAGE